MKKSKAQLYNAEIVAGALLVGESRKIAQLLLDNTGPDDWKQAIVNENILQKRTPEAAARQARLIKKRLMLMKPELWEMIVHGSSDMAVQALMAAAVKHNHLIGDFMDKVIRQHWKTFTPSISTKDWDDFMETCEQVDPTVGQWSPGTRYKVKQVAIRILAESGYLKSTRSLTLLPVTIIDDIRRYLMKNQETYVLRCMDVTQ